MDIRHLAYFIAVVENNCNLSLAAKKLNVTQPALSQIIKNFEKEQQTELFIRYNGRLQDLTAAGEYFYQAAQKIVKLYADMLREVKHSSKNHKGKVTIGMPPFVNTMLFPRFLTELIIDHPEVDFQVMESGSMELRKMLLLGEIDCAILLHPTQLDHTLMEERVIHSDQLMGYMSRQHKLAGKGSLAWDDFDQQKIALLNQHFMLHHQLLETYQEKKVYPEIAIQSNSWDFLMEAILYADLIAVLPSIAREHIDQTQIIALPFNDSTNWTVTFCRPVKNQYSYAERFFYEQLTRNFSL